MAEKSHEEGLRVIGVGLMRTGTTSLQVALERLLNGKCYHMNVIEKNRSHGAFWRNAAVKNPSDKEWHAFLADYKSAIAFPPAAFHKEMMQAFPDAKIILSQRDPEKWFVSVSSTIGTLLKSIDAFPFNVIAKLSGLNRFIDVGKVLVSRVLGPDCDFFDKEKMIAAYHRHVENVRRDVPPERLLEFQATDGWEPLCKFLGVDVPDEPYPRVNTAEDIVVKVRRLKMVSTFTAAGVLLLISAALFGSYRFGRSWFSGNLPFFSVDGEL